MASRTLLKRHIQTAWRGTIEGAYAEQLVNSERGLQVHFCHLLLEQFKAASLPRRIFVEPSLTDVDGRVRAPDIVICHSQKIIGVIELKYQPRVSPSFAKDLGILKWFSESMGELTLSNTRYLGLQSTSLKKYPLSNNAVLCWAGVYRGPHVDIRAKADLPHDQFLCIHAVTSPLAAPEIC